MGFAAVTDNTTALTLLSLGTTVFSPEVTPRIGTDAVDPAVMGATLALMPWVVENTRAGVTGTK